MITISSCILSSDLSELYLLETLIDSGWSKEMLLGAFESGSSSFLKAECDGRIIGYINYSIIFDEAEINAVSVLSDFRQKGVASKLVSHLFELLINKGVKNIFLEVNQNNVAAISFYQKMGFCLISQRKNYYGTESALIFNKKL